jgi:two-component system NtrC family sensor kinase
MRKAMQKKLHGYSRIRGTILAAMIFVPFVPFILIMGLSFYSHKLSLENGTKARMNRIVEDHRQLIENFLLERSRDIEFIINSYTFSELSDSENLRVVFERLQKKSIAFKDLGIFNAEGMHVSYQGPYQLAGRHYWDAEWFMEVVKSGFYISDVFMGYRQEPHFIIAIASGHGTTQWVARTTIDTKTFETLVNAIRIGETGEAYIVNASGVLQTSRRSGEGLLTPIFAERFHIKISDLSMHSVNL